MNKRLKEPVLWGDVVFWLMIWGAVQLAKYLGDIVVQSIKK